MEQHHSRAYHEFFKGYTEKQVISEDGKISITRVYTGEYFIPELSLCELKKKKWISFILYTAAVFTFGISGSVHTFSTVSIWSELFSTVTLLLFLWILRCMITFWTGKTPYTQWTYRQISENLTDAVRYGAYMSIVLAAVTIVRTVTNLYRRMPMNFVGIITELIGLTLCVLFLFLLHRGIKGITYRRKASHEMRPEGGFDIIS